MTEAAAAPIQVKPPKGGYRWVVVWLLSDVGSVGGGLCLI